MAHMDSVNLLLEGDLDHHGEYLAPISLACAAIITCTAGLRVWYRLLNQSLSSGCDDWLAFLAWPFVTAMNILLFFAVTKGLGRHGQALPASDAVVVRKLLLSIILTYYVGLVSIRVSLSLYYGRIFSSSAGFRKVLWANIGVNLVWGIAIFMAALFQCSDPRSLWDPSVRSVCRSPIEHQYLCSITSLILDLVVLIMPVPLILKLRLRSDKKKYGILVIFVVGYCVPIMTLGRLVSTIITGNNLNIDPNWYWIYILVWVPFETVLAFVGLCIPAFIFLVQRWRSAGFLSLFDRRSIYRLSGIESGGPIRSSLGRQTPAARRNRSIQSSDVDLLDERQYSNIDKISLAGITQTRGYTVTRVEANV